MYTNVSAEVSATLNRDDVLRLIEEGELSAEGLNLQMAEPEAEGFKKLLDKEKL